MRYTVILEKGSDAWGAYVPDLPVARWSLRAKRRRAN